MAMAELRPRTGIVQRSPRLVALLGMLLLPLVVLSGCNTGSRNETGGVGGPPVLPVDFPVLEGLSPENAQPGDLITLTGRNFSDVAAENIVTFSNFAGTIELRGVVESVNVGIFLPEEGAASSMTVRVPTGVRSGFVSLSVETADNGVVNAGGQSIAAAPVVLGYAINDDGAGLAIRRNPLTNDLVTTQVQLIGYNLVNNVTEVTFNDGTSAQDSTGVTNGAPAGASYTIPQGLEVITVDIPTANQLIPNICETSTILVTARALDGANLIGTASPLEIPYAELFGADLGDIPAYFTGVTIPTGVRAGDLTFGYNVAANPSVARWTAIFEYQDPTDPTGNTFLPCTPAADSHDGENLLPGTISGGAGGGLIAPGAFYEFTWDSAADIAPGTGTLVTRVRMTLDDAFPELGITSLACAGSFLSGLIVINNDAPTDGSILETFDDNENQDLSGNAAWNTVVPGALTGPASIAAPNFGSGTANVVLLAEGVYEIDTDFGAITDITEVGAPVDMIPGNPGATAGEFHVASLVIEEGAELNFFGSNPVIFRVAGDGNDDSVVVTLAGSLAFNGEDGTAATADDNGLGGAGSFAGGGDGGDGALITTNANQEVVDLEPAEDGGLNGGEAGPSATLVLAGTSSSTPRAGPGGGGGHDGPGEDGVNSFITTSPYNTLVGRGGATYGDSAITVIRGGSGGGGGGAAPVRLSSTNFQEKHGGGGGGGGGAFAVVARGSVRLLGTIRCDGGSGAVGSSGTQAGAGGGGAGGSILVRATGNIELGSEMVLSAAGGFGGVTNPGNPLRGGNGADGRIRLEASGQLLSPGINQGDFSPAIGVPGVTEGVSSGTIFTGTGLDGVLDSSVLGSSGVYTIDTDLGRIFDSMGVELFANVGGGGTFELTRLDVPTDVTLVGVGSNPLIFRVTGLVDVRGRIDVSGQDGGLPDFTDVANPVPGIGGLAGAGGGVGGSGGSGNSMMMITMPEAGGLPPNMPPQLISSSPPLGGGGNGGSPVPGDPAVAAQPGVSLVGDGSGCTASSGGGGGYAADGGNGSAASGCPSAGIGGTGYGATFFLVSDPANPSEPIELLVGGGGGAGGGGFTDGVDVVSGTGGGGAGGFLQISAGGQLKIHATAQILAEGGDAFQAPFNAGNGGGGAGGAVRLRGESRVEIEEGALISVLPGLANQTNPAATYIENGEQTGGDGTYGRVRVETPLGFSDGEELAVTPAFTFGPFATAGLAERRAISTPFRTSPDGATVRSPANFLDPIVTFLNPLPADAHVITLFEGANPAQSNPGVPGTFFGLTDDVTDLDGAEFIRLRVFLYSSEMNSPEIDSIELPFGN